MRTLTLRPSATGLVFSRSRVLRCCHGQGLRVTRACPSGPAFLVRLVLPRSVRLTRTANATEAAGRRGQEEPSTARTTAPAEVLRHPARLGISLGPLPRAPLLFPWGRFRSRRHTAGVSSTLSGASKRKAPEQVAVCPGASSVRVLTYTSILALRAHGVHPSGQLS